MEHILDNPIYNALRTGHRIFAEGNENATYYTATVASFAGLATNSEQDFETLYKISPADSFFIVFTPTAMAIPRKWELVTHIDMFQLCYELKELPAGNDIGFSDLADRHVPEMEALVSLTKPGPFLPRTIELGNYTGVFKDKELVAMAGHRFNPSPYTEISAVCTRPDHLGNGYAYGLLREQIKRILAKTEIPFLHVRDDNEGAIKLYQKLGFEIRTPMIAYVIRKKTATY
ncbi:MAG: GNAT family N-acetyltransferase [Bacteroidota bacterium]